MPSRFTYAQLQTSNLAAAKEFYAELCGWTLIDDPPGGPPYTEVMAGADPVAGLMPAPAPGVPSFWLLFLSVDDTDQATARAERLGARIVTAPMDIAPKNCRISVLTDPTGAVFALRGPLRGGG
jgi:uncharacterized protein